MNKNIKSILILVTLIFLLCSSLFHSTIIVSKILEYTELFYQKLFPSSFFFFLLSYMLLEYNFLEVLTYLFSFNMSSFYVLIFSLISGVPSGAKIIRDLLKKGKIDLEEANHFLLFSHFPNPLFVFGAVSSIIQDSTLTLFLFLSIFFSNFLLFLTVKKKKNSFFQVSSFPSNFSDSLRNAILSSSKTILLIYGTSLFFYLFGVILNHFLSLKSYEFVLWNGIFDLTKGVFSTTILSSSKIRAFFILFFLSFGSISIHMQVLSLLSDTDISYSFYLKGRIMGTFLAFCFFHVFLFFLN